MSISSAAPPLIRTLLDQIDTVIFIGEDLGRVASVALSPRDADPLTPDGYRLEARCSCGARLERWVMPAGAEADLLRSALLAFEN